MKAEITVHRIVKETKKTGQFIEPHKHTFYHLMYGISGTAFVTVQEIDEHGISKDCLYHLNKGALITVPPNKIHAIYSETKSVILTVKFTCTSFLESLILSIPTFISHVNNYQEMLLRNMLEEAIDQDPNHADIIDLRTYELFINLNRTRFCQTSHIRTTSILPYSAKSARLSKIIEYIDSHLESSLTVADVSKISGYSASYFSAYFKENIGYTPNYYINLRKMERAKELMLFSELNITQISEKLGYDSVHYFSRTFKKLIGITPTEYITRSRTEQVINVVINQNTPSEKFEIPLRDWDKCSFEFVTDY